MTGSNPSFTTRGINDTTIVGDSVNTLLGNNLAQAMANNGNLSYNVLFGQTIYDNSAGADTQFEIFYFELIPSNEPYLLQAIIGGTSADPIFGGNTVTVSNMDYASVEGLSPSATSDAQLDRTGSDADLNATYGGTAFDLSEFGVTELIGIRFVSNAGSADPAAILAIPEPSSLILGLFAITALIGFGRRWR